MNVPLINHGAAVFKAAWTGKRKMMKRIYYLGSAALGVALLSACGSTGAKTVDLSKLSTGETNQVATGGYIWTYTDHNKTPTTTPDPNDSTTWDYHATIQPLTNPQTPFLVAPDDASHGNVLRVSGTVPVEIPWKWVSTQAPVSIDTYWPTFYPDAMVPAYPAAGLGFGFLPNNAVYDASQNGQYVGIAFDLKANVAAQLIWVSMPMDLTDLPDPSNHDAFTQHCQYYTATNDPLNGGSSCFTNYRKGIFAADTTVDAPGTYNTMADVGTWHRYCVLFSELGVPSWANTLTQTWMQAIPFDPKHALKVQWDMFQPKGEGDAVPFDFSVDNIDLITAAQASDPANPNNCDPAMVGKPMQNAMTSDS